MRPRHEWLPSLVVGVWAELVAVAVSVVFFIREKVLMIGVERNTRVTLFLNNVKQHNGTTLSHCDFFSSETITIQQQQ